MLDVQKQDDRRRYLEENAVCESHVWMRMDWVAGESWKRKKMTIN